MGPDILIVDDSETVRTSLCNWLKSVFPSWSIEEAACGQEAIDCVLVTSPWHRPHGYMHARDERHRGDPQD